MIFKLSARSLVVARHQESRENFYIPRGDDFDSDHSTNGCGQAWNDNDNSDQKPGTGECELVTRWWSDATSGVVLTQVGLVVLLANLYHMLEAYMGTRFVMRGNELQDQVFTGSGCLSRSEVQVTCKTSWPVGEGSVSLEGIFVDIGRTVFLRNFGCKGCQHIMQDRDCQLHPLEMDPALSAAPSGSV